MKIDQENQIIYVRQSWLGDMAICPERARLGQVKPEFRTGSDATIIGTAVHAGIEQVLKGETNEFVDMLEFVNNEYETLQNTNYTITNIEQEKIPSYLEAMSLAFYNDIMPHVKLGGTPEMFFRVPLGIRVEGYDVHLEGTMDYVDPDGDIWDWKTAKRIYNQKEKQKSAIQPTVYATAVRNLGLSENPTFSYGVMVRQETPKAQILSVTRGAEHTRWLQHYVKGAVTTALKSGYQNEWIMNDSSALCSSQWCSYWSVCKGAFNLE
jgi:hypothetical protein